MQRDSTEKTALAVAATAAVDLTNLFFLLRGDTDTDTERQRRWGWTGGISVLLAFAALLSAAGLVLVLLHTTVVVSAARRRVLLVASAAALFVASAGTVLLALLDAQGLPDELYPVAHTFFFSTIAHTW
ncbi:unnamed protein product [Miscanthus lutarioriparius]|uniref:Uncharacterized protein n=1 Tax=Miscanthus lutarioriparius TaxID=422564 RepID=A0A811PWM6_9POAL|nr:unnamed protein product [Miscanthus lutarioriparius]